jgi:hypothetical protein
VETGWDGFVNRRDAEKARFQPYTGGLDILQVTGIFQKNLSDFPFFGYA